MSEFNYPWAWKKFWERWLGTHSMMRCPGHPCPGGCGANAKEELAKLAEQEKQRKERVRLKRKARG
jgi:hypothetical protein